MILSLAQIPLVKNFDVCLEIRDQKESMKTDRQIVLRQYFEQFCF